eukprot:6083283-Pleurochrysis_carterae.AAC.1
MRPSRPRRGWSSRRVRVRTDASDVAVVRAHARTMWLRLYAARAFQRAWRTCRSLLSSPEQLLGASVLISLW